MRTLSILFCILICTLAVSAQEQVTVSQLPDATVNKSKVYLITDALTYGQCTPGGGTLRFTCISDGTNWVPLNSPVTKTDVGLSNVDNTSDANKPVSTATQTALNLKAPIASPTFTGTVSGITGAMVGLGNVPNTDATNASNIASGTLNAARLPTAITVTGSLGYATGAGGTVTQLTSKSTGVTLNKVSGSITTHNAALAAGAEVKFTVTNSTVAATDVVILAIKSGGTSGAYLLTVGAVGSGTFDIVISNASAGSLSEAVVINFVVIKGVAS